MEQKISTYVNLVNDYVASYLKSIEIPQAEAILELRDSMSYSATNGGKRFRPVLSLLVADLLDCPKEKILPFATAVEFIHTYSLIHDDLPCMDNDDIRRGKPTNHKVYGESFALLAGDALLTEAFLILAKFYDVKSGELIKLLSNAAGIRGMVGGQAIDLRANKNPLSVAELTELHNLKTGALIRVSVVGAALIANASESQIHHLTKFGEGIGLAFQIADDILDHGEKDQDVRSFTGLLGLEQTQALLDKTSSETQGFLRQISDRTQELEFLISFNQKRKI